MAGWWPKLRFNDLNYYDFKWLKRFVLLGMFETISYTCSLYHIDYMPQDSENYPFFKINDDFYFLFHMDES